MKNENVKVSQVTLTQEGDSCDGDLIQYLTIKIEDAGGGDYYVIETQRWAVDSISELIKQLNTVNIIQEGK